MSKSQGSADGINKIRIFHSVLPNKEIQNNAESQALRRVRNRGYVVPKKVQNRPTNK